MTWGGSRETGERKAPGPIASCRLTSSLGLGSFSIWEGVLVRPDTVTGLLPKVSINSGHHQSWHDATHLGSSVSLPEAVNTMLGDTWKMQGQV